MSIKYRLLLIIRNATLMCIGGFFLFSVFLVCAETEIDSIYIPEEYGNVIDRHQGKSDALVFYISDVHDSFEAQQSISNIIEFITNYYNVEIVGIEGAEGGVEVSDLKAYYNEAVKDSVSAYYLGKGHFGGAVNDAIVSAVPVNIVGFEDEALYEKNLEIYRQTLDDREAVLGQIGYLEDMLVGFKEKMYSEEMLQLEKESEDYNAGVISLIDYCRQLVFIATKFYIPIDDYANLSLVKEIISIENKIDFLQVDTEEKKLTIALKKAIGKELNDLSMLKSAISEFKEKKIESEEYYDILYQLSAKYKIDVNEYHNLFAVIKTTNIMKKINSLKMYYESQTLHAVIQDKLLSVSANKEVETLLTLANNLETLKDVVTFRADNKGVEEYLENRSAFSSPRFIRFIRQNALFYDVPYRIHSNIVEIDKIYSLIREFYELCDQRSEIFYNDIKKYSSKKETKKIVFVAGDYHSVEILEKCKNDGISYIHIIPQITRLKSTIPIDELLSGDKSTLFVYLSSLLSNLKPWITLDHFGDRSNRPYRLLYQAEFIIEDLFMRLHGTKEEIDEKTFSREIVLLERELKQHGQEFSIEPLHYVSVPALDMEFIEVRITESKESLRLMFELLSTRQGSYAGEKIANIEILQQEQLDRGIYRSSDRLLSILEKDHQAKIVEYKKKYKKEIEKEYEEVQQRKRKEKEIAALENVTKQHEEQRERLSTDESNQEAIRERLEKIKNIEQAALMTDTLDDLNLLKNRFLIIKSQLSFYPLSYADKKQMKILEEKLNAKIDGFLRELELFDVKQREKEAEAQEQRRRDTKERLREENQKIREQLDVILSQVVMLTDEVSSADSLVSLNAIEEKFNTLVAGLRPDNLLREDKDVLRKFKGMWEEQYYSLQNRIKEQRKKDFDVGLGKYVAVKSAVLERAYNFKELVDLSSIPADAEFVLTEFEKLKSEIDVSKLQKNEAIILDKIEQYIRNVITSLQSEAQQERLTYLAPLMKQAIKTGPKTEEIGEELSVEDYFSHIYVIRSQALTSSSVDELRELEKKFNSIDEILQQHSLSDEQKHMLADTERILKESLRKAIISIERKAKDEQSVKDEEYENQKNMILKELLGEDAALFQNEKKNIIALIENNAFERNMLKERFEKEGYVVKSFDNYDTARRLLNKESVNLVLMDDDIIQGTTGIDFAIKIKTLVDEEYFKKLPVIIHTNSSISWTTDILKRKGLSRENDVYVISKRDLDKNITLINKLLKK